MANVLLVRADHDDDLSYITGVYLGDGTFRISDKGINKTPSHSLVLQNTDRDFVIEFAKRLDNLLGEGRAKIGIEIPKVSSYKLIYRYGRHSHDLYQKLNRPFSELEIINPLQCLKGLYDSEGSISFYWSDTRLYKSITLSMTNLEIIEYTKKTFESYSFHCTITIQKTHTKFMKDGHWLIPNKPFCYYLQIRRKSDIIRFAEIMPKLIPSKQKKLEQLLMELQKIGYIHPKTGKRIYTVTTRNRISKAKFEYWKDNPKAREYIAKLTSKTMSQLWQDPIYRQRMSKITSEAMRKFWASPKSAECRHRLSKKLSTIKREWWKQKHAQCIVS